MIIPQKWFTVWVMFSVCLMWFKKKKFTSQHKKELSSSSNCPQGRDTWLGGPFSLPGVTQAEVIGSLTGAASEGIMHEGEGWTKRPLSPSSSEILWLCIFFICKIDLAVLVPCSFMWILGSALTFWSELHWICEGSFRKCCHLHSIESYSPWTRNTIPFIYAIFYIFQQCFVVLSVHFLHLLESGYSYIVYCLWCC